MTMTNFTGLGTTRTGQTKQVNRGYKGLAADMKRKQSVAVEPVPMTAAQYECIITDLRQQLADAQALIAEMRAQANGDAPAAAISTTKYWDSKTVAEKSGVAVCTICRNADTLGGMKLGGDWLFPAGTTYGHKRNRKAK